MSVNHASMTTHVPQSLPSFAQAFSNQSLSSISSGNNALPPIQSHRSPMDNNRVHNSPQPRSRSRPASTEENAEQRTAGRKRAHHDIMSGSRDEVPSDSDRASPTAVRVKEEQDQDMLDPSPPPLDRAGDQRSPPQDFSGAPPPSSLMPSPMKKRRMTVSGAPHALNTDVRVPADQTNSTPISPVVMGFTIQPKEIEQVKSMINVKQKQKALIEQRRGSVVGSVSANPPPSSVEDRNSSIMKTPVAPIPARPSRRSPNGGAGLRRIANPHPLQPSGINRATSPNQSIFQMQQTVHMPNPPSHTLAPPPISFARRRAAQMGKKKPADIVISPRELQTPDQFQPSIHSAPPIPNVQGSLYSGRYQMALPRLPNIMGGGENIRRQASNVPPTPTRLSQRMNMSSSSIPPSITISESTPRSPIASVPIASTLVPPTPTAFHNTDYSGDKAAFLAPFAVFYDALNDAKQLKTWLGEQLQRSNTLFHSLSQQQEKLNETVESVVERKLSGVYSEITGLRRRVGELEDALRDANSMPRSSLDLYHNSKSLQNGFSGSSGLLAPDSYTFPPQSSEHTRLRSDLSSGRVSSPVRGQDRDSRSGQYLVDAEHDSAASFDARRMSVSASRLDPPRSQTHPHDTPPLPPPAPPLHTRISLSSMQSPPQLYRESPTNHAGGHGKSVRSVQVERERPALSRQPSHTGSHGERERDPAENAVPRRSASRRNSVVKSPPDARMDDS